MKFSEKQYWYHVSGENLGIHPTFSLRDPDFVSETIEPMLPRICVAPTIHHCLIAIRHRVNDRLPLFVYKTPKVKAVYPFREYYTFSEMHELGYINFDKYSRQTKTNRFVVEVVDAHITKEMWILNKTRLKLVGIIEKPIVKKINEIIPKFLPGDKSALHQQKKALNILIKTNIKYY